MKIVAHIAVVNRLLKMVTLKIIFKDINAKVVKRDLMKAQRHLLVKQN